MEPLVSIIIPCFNAEKTVGDAITSALAQTYRNREVIVIDDGSTDGSLEVIRSFGNEIRWETGPNRGGNHARNRGIKLSLGEFIQFLDADDLLYPNKLEVMTGESFRLGAHKIVASSWDLQSVGEVDFKAHSFCFDGSDAFGWCLNNDLQTSAPLHRKDLLTEFGCFDEKLRCCQEYDLHLRLFAKDIQLKTINIPLYRFRRQSNSVSSDLTRILLGKRLVLEKLVRSLKDHHSASLRLRQIATRIASDARLLARQREWKECRASFRLAEELNPMSIGDAFRGTAVSWVADWIGPHRAERMLLTAKSLLRRK